MECWRRGFRPKGILHAVLPNMGTVFSDASCVCHLMCKLHVPMFGFIRGLLSLALDLRVKLVIWSYNCFTGRAAALLENNAGYGEP